MKDDPCVLLRVNRNTLQKEPVVWGRREALDDLAERLNSSEILTFEYRVEPDSRGVENPNDVSS